MITKVTLLAVCLIVGQPLALSQTQRKSRPPSVRPVSLRQVGRYAESYTPDTLKLSGVVLEDVRSVEDDWVHVFQLYDPRSKTRRGEKFDGMPYHPHHFLICSDEGIGEPLLARKERWLNRRVNVYLRIFDRGVTVHLYVGSVEKVELLDEKGRVEETISSGR
jgi:hypothetical protein